jgi:hypothetical protein
VPSRTAAAAGPGDGVNRAAIAMWQAAAQRAAAGAAPVALINAAPAHDLFEILVLIARTIEIQYDIVAYANASTVEKISKCTIAFKTIA